MSSSFFTAPLFPYDKGKNLLLKAFLPFMIIVHHTMQVLLLPMYTLFGAPVMYAFFAMSGFGLVSSYLNRKGYLDDFLPKSLLKLFVPYLSALVIVVFFKFCQGISPIDYFCNTNFLSLVPYSWFIFCLALFYLFFYFVFKYVKVSDLNKVLIVSLLVFAYVVILRSLSFPGWSHSRCLPFCIGMFFALYDSKICRVLVRWQLFGLLALFFIFTAVLGVEFCVLRATFPFLIYICSLSFGVLFFLLLYSIPSIPESRFVKFISSISLEMYILQHIPIFLFVGILCIHSFYLAILPILALDILLAYFVQKVDKLAVSRLLRVLSKK